MCQNDWKKEPTLCAVSLGRPKERRAHVHVLRLCHGVDGRKGAQQRVRGRTALWWCERKSLQRAAGAEMGAEGGWAGRQSRRCVVSRAELQEKV